MVADFPNGPHRSLYFTAQKNLRRDIIVTPR
jgi:hypothetical protein